MDAIRQEMICARRCLFISILFIKKPWINKLGVSLSLFVWREELMRNTSHILVFPHLINERTDAFYSISRFSFLPRWYNDEIQDTQSSTCPDSDQWKYELVRRNSSTSMNITDDVCLKSKAKSISNNSTVFIGIFINNLRLNECVTISFD